MSYTPHLIHYSPKMAVSPCRVMCRLGTRQRCAGQRTRTFIPHQRALPDKVCWALQENTNLSDLYVFLAGSLFNTIAFIWQRRKQPKPTTANMDCGQYLSPSCLLLEKWIHGQRDTRITRSNVHRDAQRCTHTHTQVGTCTHFVMYTLSSLAHLKCTCISAWNLRFKLKGLKKCFSVKFDTKILLQQRCRRHFLLISVCP